MKTIFALITPQPTSLLAGGIAAALWFACSSTALAAPVTSKQAAAVVTGWLSLDPSPLGATLGTAVERVDTFNDADGNPLYYVAYLDPSGFVIVAGDDQVEPIIGFAPTGQFDPSTNNPLAALVSSDVAARLTYAREVGSTNTDTSTAQAQAKWQELCPPDGGPVIAPEGYSTVSNVWVAPFLQTTWDQQTAAGAGTTACYNYYTPPYGDGNVNNYPAGCVATAMAQLMRYFQFPTTGVGSLPFTITIDGAPGTYYLRGGDGAGGPYVWSNMPLAPPVSPLVAQCQAIGALVADAGATVNMDYASGGSSSSPMTAKSQLISTFQFASARFAYNHGSNLGSGLTGIINPNLDARLPVILSIEGAGPGHAVVADGYGYSLSTLYHHLNLGWSGAETAWYALPTIDTSPEYFNVVDGCIYNVYTNGSGEIISGRVTDQLSRPVAGATVTATRSGGGTYTATTDSQGIYALTKLPSASSYSISVTRTYYSSASANFSTGTSSDQSATSGNYWGANFTLNMLPTVVDHLIWSSLATTQSLNAPFAVTVTAFNADNGLVTGFAGPVALSAHSTAFGTATTVIGNLSWTSGRSSSAGLTYGYSFTPSTNIQVTAVRTYGGDKVSIWTDSGSNLVTQAISASGSWVEATLPTPIVLAAGTTYRIGTHCGPGQFGYYTTSWPTTFVNGIIGQTFYSTLGDNFPTQIFATGQGPLVDLRYRVVISNAIPISPTSAGTFVNGAWSGNVTLSQVATNVVLKADDGAGHVAASNPFNLIDSNAAPPTITTQPQSQTNNIGDNATFTVVATSTQTPGYVWRRSGSPISGANSSSYTLNNVQLADSGSQFSCVVTNNYGSVTSQTAVLTVICTNVVVAAQPAVTLNAGAEVYAVAPLSDGSVILGGYFTNVNGISRSGLARLLPNGTLDLNWNPAPNGSVYALAVSGTDLYVGGGFTTIGGYGRVCIAKLSTTGTGAADPTWNPNADYYVEAIVVNGSDVYVGGDFANIGGQPRSCVAKLSATGSGAADPTWNPNASISGDYPYVDSLALSGASIYVGGYFTGIGGMTRWGIAKLSSTGTGAADATWNPSANSTVDSIAVKESDVYVGGGFTYIGGRTRNHIAKLSSSGTGAADATWNPNASDQVWSVVVNGLYIYAGGAFVNVGGLARTNLARLSRLGTGAADSAWAADCDGETYTLASTSTALYLGGAFTHVAGQLRPGVAALTYAPLQLLSPQRTPGGQFQCTLTSERGQAIEILASANLTNWASVATLTNTTGTTNFMDTTPGLARRFYRAHQLQ